MAGGTEILIKTEDRQEVEKITALIKSMNTAEQKNMLFFMQGAKFAENLRTTENEQEG